ncbi:MAG: hypothetical protein MJ204_09055 [Bacteroidales bacterium]|nr:hypothetical protein [Bacteroidales bacterium]MCQ2608474.1 hypothetical protein [Bacteroidales bacterium]
MAHIIKETPILKGTDAENFVKNLYKKPKTNASKLKTMKQNAEYLKSIATFKL